MPTTKIDIEAGFMGTTIEFHCNHMSVLGILSAHLSLTQNAVLRAKVNASPMRRPRVLFVDDCEENHLVMDKLFSQHLPACDLLMSKDTQTLLEHVSQTPPDCAIVDVNMPGTDGIVLCQQIKEQTNTTPFPILLVTAQSSDSDLRVRGFEAGADDFIEWPCEDIELVARIRVLLRVKHAEDELRSVNKRLTELISERSMELHESDARYQLLFNACSDAIFVLGLNDNDELGNFTEVNDVACQLVGYSRKELSELDLSSLLHQDWATTLPLGIEAIMYHKRLFLKTVFASRDGRHIPVSINAQRFDISRGRVVVLLIRPTKSSQDVLDSVDHYNMLVAQTGQMLAEFNVRTGVTQWTGAVKQVAGYTANELASFNREKLASLIHRDDLAKVQLTFNEALQNMSRYHIEFRMCHKSGDFRYLEHVGVAIPGEDGEVERLLGTLKDITPRVLAEQEKRRLEQKHQHSQQLESLGVLAGGIAHDFNNILAAIIGLTDMATRDLPENSETQNDLKEVLTAAYRAKELVTQIMTFSRQNDEERKPLSLHIIVREVLKLLRATLPSTIEIIDNVDVHSGMLMANATRMHQVIMNYCTNSAQAMGKQGGWLEVQLEDVEVDEALAMTHPKLQPGPYLKLSVIDTGHGMQKKVLNRVFDPFFTTKGPGEGTGMGLSVAHGIVSEHGGAIMVESKLGQGTTFHTYFPRTEQIVAEEHSNDYSRSGGEERILLVDDEEAILRFGKSSLTELGYHVETCENGLEALELFQDNPSAFDLIITDQVMPKMQGDALCAALKNMRADIPVILFTGYSDQVSETRASEIGIEELILKPVIVKELAQAIRKVLDKCKSPV
jgi:PAS domain S-box-containing protein